MGEPEILLGLVGVRAAPVARARAPPDDGGVPIPPSAELVRSDPRPHTHRYSTSYSPAYVTRAAPQISFVENLAHAFINQSVALRPADI